MAPMKSDRLKWSRTRFRIKIRPNIANILNKAGMVWISFFVGVQPSAVGIQLKYESASLELNKS